MSLSVFMCPSAMNSPYSIFLVFSDAFLQAKQKRQAATMLIGQLNFKTWIVFRKSSNTITVFIKWVMEDNTFEIHMFLPELDCMDLDPSCVASPPLSANRETVLKCDRSPLPDRDRSRNRIDHTLRCSSYSKRLTNVTYDFKEDLTIQNFSVF